MIFLYIDAGSGSALLALLAGGVSGIWIYIKSIFSRKSKDMDLHSEVNE